MSRLGYLARSVAGQFDKTRHLCPNCGGRGAAVARKYLVTALRRCERCALQYRAPTDSPAFAERFYNEDYVQGQTTRLPSAEDLERMKASDFAELENDYAGFARTLKSLGAEEGARVFDYGCSWGYGSYLFRQAGFAVKSFEISRPRRSYGERHLGIDLVEDFDAFVAGNAGTFDVFFSSHVLEHVPSPGSVIDKGLALLKPGGLLVSLFPNGSASRRAADPTGWGYHWGEVHPNYLDEVFLARSLADMAYLLGCSPVTIGADDLRHLVESKGERRLDPLTGHELFVAARKPA